MVRTKDCQITLNRDKNKQNRLVVATDASLATGFDLKSRIGGLILYGNNLIYGFSKKSTIICDSSTEAEIDALNLLSHQLKSAGPSCYFVMCGSVYSRDLCRVTSYSEEYYLP